MFLFRTFVVFSCENSVSFGIFITTFFFFDKFLSHYILFLIYTDQQGECLLPGFWDFFSGREFPLLPLCGGGWGFFFPIFRSCILQTPIFPFCPSFTRMLLSFFSHVQFAVTVIFLRSLLLHFWWFWRCWIWLRVAHFLQLQETKKKSRSLLNNQEAKKKIWSPVCKIK